MNEVPEFDVWVPGPVLSVLRLENGALLARGKGFSFPLPDHARKGSCTLLNGRIEIMDESGKVVCALLPHESGKSVMWHAEHGIFEEP